MSSIDDLQKSNSSWSTGADVNYVDGYGDSALQFAAHLDAWATMSYLIENGWRGNLTRVARFAQRSRVKASWAVAELERARRLIQERGIWSRVPGRGSR
jgi:hypothetical protein